MAEIQRYANRRCESVGGSWVLHDDHLADKTAALEAQAEEHERDLLGLRCQMGQTHDGEINRLHQDHAREIAALVEGHREKLEHEEEQWANQLNLERLQHAKDLAEARREGEPALIQFEHPFLIGEPCMIHRDYRPTMDRLCDIAYDCDVKIWVTHSVRYLDQEMLDLVVKKAKRSNHLAGSAVDMNPVYQGVWYTSEMMKDRSNLPADVWKFLYSVLEDPHLRWGGDFNVNKDPVHFDGDLVRRDPDEWARRVKELNDV